MTRLIPCFFVLALVMTSGSLAAQSPQYHPFLSDSFTASLGAMRSSNSFKIEADGREEDDLGTFVDFEDSLGVDSNSTFFNGQIRWKFGREQKWNLSGQYFSNNAKGEAVLTKDVEWEGVIFREGTFVNSGVKLAIARLVIGRSFFKNEQHDFGIGVGIHNLDASAFIEGEVLFDDDTTGFDREEISGSQILPNIGGWYNFSPAAKWLLHGRVDWISADINGYGGHMWNTTLGVSYQAWRHVGFDVYWQYFNIQIRADKEDWRGRADMEYSGPVVAMTFNW